MCSLCSVIPIQCRDTSPLPLGSDHTPTTAATSAVSTWTQSSSSIPLPPVVETEAHQLLPPAGGVSMWTKSSSGGPPAPGQTSEGEEGLGGVAGLEPLASSEDQGLTAPRYTLRWAAISQGVGVGMARGLLDPLASAARTRGSQVCKTRSEGQKLVRSCSGACVWWQGLTLQHVCLAHPATSAAALPSFALKTTQVCCPWTRLSVHQSVQLLSCPHPSQQLIIPCCCMTLLLQRRPPRVTTHWKEQVPGPGDGRCDPHNQRRARAAEHKPRLAAQVRGGRQLRHAAARPSLVCNNACHVAGLCTSNCI